MFNIDLFIYVKHKISQYNLELMVTHFIIRNTITILL